MDHPPVQHAHALTYTLMCAPCSLLARYRTFLRWVEMCNYSYAMLPRETRRLMRRRQQLMTKFSAILANQPPETVRELQWTLRGLFTRWVELTQTCKVRRQVVKRFMDLQRCRLLSRAFHAMKHSIRVKYAYVALPPSPDGDEAGAVVASRTAIARQRRVENAAARRQVSRSVSFDERRALFELNKWKLLVLHHEMHLHSNWHRRKNKFVALQLRRHTMKDVTLKKRLDKFSQQVRTAAECSMRNARAVRCVWYTCWGTHCSHTCGGGVGAWVRVAGAGAPTGGAALAVHQLPGSGRVSVHGHGARPVGLERVTAADVQGCAQGQPTRQARHSVCVAVREWHRRQVPAPQPRCRCAAHATASAVVSCEHGMTLSLLLPRSYVYVCIATGQVFHGHRAGARYFFDLKPDEVIVAMEGAVAHLVGRVRFYTSKGRVSQWYGRGKHGAHFFAGTLARYVHGPPFR